MPAPETTTADESLRVDPLMPDPSVPLPTHKRPLTRLLTSVYFWIAVLALALLLPLARSLWGTSAPLPVLWQMPPWSLTTQDGRAFGGDQLRGRVYVANFIFTTCTWSCPRLSSRMAALYERVRGLGDRVHLVSISVDPTNDTPERLRYYAARYHANHRTWTFLTGEQDTVLRAISQGFRVGVVSPPRGPNGEFNAIELAHSNRFALVDQRGRLRGSYEVDDEGFERLVRDVHRLARDNN